MSIRRITTDRLDIHQEIMVEGKDGRKSGRKNTDVGIRLGKQKLSSKNCIK